MSDAPIEDDSPFQEQRRVYELLSQETRHLIVQFVLGHSSHLPSLGELAYLIPKNKAAIRDQLEVLEDANLLARYEYAPNEGSRGLPSQFYGPTEHGVEVLAEYNYLRGLPFARAIYDNTRLSEKAERHRDAPRPDLPPPVRRALAMDTASADFERLEGYIRERKQTTQSADAQVEMAKAFYNDGIGPDHDGVKRTDLRGTLDVDIDYRLETVLDHLVDVGVLSGSAPPGPDVFAISKRASDIVDGRVTEEARENLDALVAHIDDELQSIAVESEHDDDGEQGVASPSSSIAVADGAGRTVRGILATEFDRDPERVVDYLRSGDPADRLNEAVDAIDSSEVVNKSGDYDRIVFVRPAYRYRLTEHAMDLIDEHEPRDAANGAC